MVSKGGKGAFGLILEPLPSMGGRAPGVDGLGHLVEGLPPPRQKPSPPRVRGVTALTFARRY